MAQKNQYKNNGIKSPEKKTNNGGVDKTVEKTPAKAFYPFVCLS
jgi:hypothetical protein